MYDVNIYNDIRRIGEQRIFPDINFTYSGILTREVQIWRRNAGSEYNYTKVGYSVLNATDPDNDHVYEYVHP